MQQTLIANVVWLLTLSHIIYYLVLKLFGKKFINNQLNCGLFGFSGKGDINVVKFIGWANDSRGGDGCGYFHDGFIYKGFGKTEKFSKYASENRIVLNPEATVFLGHTRKASLGTKIVIENTHPFLIDKNFVFAHNGKIDNIKDLVEKYEIDTTDMTVDSHMFGAIIKRSNSFDVLNDYKGYAAISFIDNTKPNKVFLYHGASKDYAAGEITEERPLFILKQKECIYWSSLIEPLEVIKGEDDKIISLDCNTLYRLEKARLCKMNITIERENNNCYNWDCLKKEFKIPVTYPNSNRTNIAKAQQELRYPSHTLNESDWENFSNGGRTPDYSRNNIKIGQQSLPPARTYPHAPTDPDKKIKIFNIKCEYKPSDILRKTGIFSTRKTDIIYYHKGLHHVLKPNGTFDVADGVYYATKDTGEAILSNEPYVNLDKGTELTYTIEEIKGSCKRYCFFRGVLLNNNTLPEFMSALLKDEDNIFDLTNVISLSNYSTYPIVSNDSTDVMWYHNGKTASASPIKPQFTNRAYTILKGRLIRIEDVKDKIPMSNLIVGGYEPSNQKVDIPPLDNFKDTNKVIIPPKLIAPFVSDETSSLTTKELEIRNKAMRCIQNIDYKKETLGSLLSQCEKIYSSLSDMNASLSIHVENAISQYFFDLQNCLVPFSSDDEGREQTEQLATAFYVQCVEEKCSIMNKFSGSTMSLIKDYIVLEISKFNSESNDSTVNNTDDTDDLSLTKLQLSQDKEAELYIDILLNDRNRGDCYLYVADELQTLDASDYAQDVSAALYRSEDFLTAQLKTIFEKHNKSNNLKTLTENEKAN